MKRVPADSRHKAIRYLARLTPRARYAFLLLVILFVIRIATGREIAGGSPGNLALRALGGLVLLLFLSYLYAAALDWTDRRARKSLSR